MDTDPSPTSPQTLLVSTHRRWIYEDLAKAAAHLPLDVVYDLGVSLPQCDPARTAIWTPVEQAARLLYSGFEMPLVSAGPYWLSHISRRWTARKIWSGRVDQLGSAPRSGWCKPAEIKHPQVPAGFWDHIDGFRRLAEQHLHPDTVVQVCPDVLDIQAEVRTFVAAGRVQTSSLYILDGEIFDYDRPFRSNLQQQGAAFARRVVDALGDDQPTAWVLDVALCRQRGWCVLESNPVWSSGYYGADIGWVLWSVLRGIDPYSDRWRWQPDPYLVEYARRRGPLPARQS